MVTQGDDDDDEKLVRLLKKRLKDKKCFVVLDDVWKWDIGVMNVRILLTSRQVIENSSILRVPLLDEEESKKLLGEKVFGEKGFPPHLEKLGEKIVKKCEGLPLMIVIVAELLSKEDKTPEFWTEVAEKQHSEVFEDAYNQTSEVFFPSYDYLPQYLKMFFLYLGAYPPYRDIRLPNLFNMLNAEGFLEPIGTRTLNDFLYYCSKNLAQRYHLVRFESNPRFNQGSWFSTNEFRVHSCWQHLCREEASKIKFLHVLQSCDDVMKDQHRLCAHCNTVFAFEQVCDSIKDDCASTTRSLLCLGPHHPYPVPIHAMYFKLLRVLEASQVRFYHIPLEILKLVCLKFLALTCNKELPIFISNLFNLQFLIIFPHLSIKRRGALSYMPLEIWNMQELKHIEFYGRDLPSPNFDATLCNLLKLFGMSAKSCTREILQKIPNLEGLEIQIELKPYDDDDDGNPLSGLDYISEELKNLNLLTCHIINPDMKYEFLVPHSMFSSSVTILRLSGLGCPWKHINDIGSLLPSLTNLVLTHYAFRGTEWDIESGHFLKLETLVIEDTDLVRWRGQHGSLPMLKLLSMRHCYKLRQLKWRHDSSIVTTCAIELVECNPLVVASAKQLKPKSHFKVRCYSSF